MTVRSMTRVVAAVALVAALALGSTVAPAPAGADPADTYLPQNVLSKQYSIGGCLYKVLWGNYGAIPYMRVNFYNRSACGGTVVAIQYAISTTATVQTFATTVSATGSDGCGAYEVVQATGAVGFAVRGLVLVGGGYRWYALDGLNTQTIHSHC